MKKTYTISGTEIGSILGCQCGCGGTPKTPGRDYLRGHNWKNREVNGKYPTLTDHNHPNSNCIGVIREHRAIASKVIGKPLGSGIVVHHFGTELVICQNQAYHNLLHLREKALNACGHAIYRKCLYCKKWSAPQDMKFTKSGGAYHQACDNKYRVELRRRRRG